MGSRPALVLASVLVTSVAHAEPERAAVIAVDLGPKLPAYLRTKATARLEEGLATAGFRAVPAAEVKQKLPAALVGCREGACLSQVGQALSATTLVIAAITGKDESTIIEIRVVEAATGQALGSVREVCDLCGAVELEERIAIAASLVRSKVEEERARRKSEADARRRPPDDPKRRPEPGPSVATTKRISKLGIAIVGGGALVTGVGIYLIAIDGNGTCKPGDTPEFPDPGAVIRFPDPGDRSKYICKEQYKTLLPGALATGVGVAALAAGVALVVRGKTEHVVVAPMPGGATVGATWSW